MRILERYWARAPLFLSITTKHKYSRNINPENNAFAQRQLNVCTDFP